MASRETILNSLRDDSSVLDVGGWAKPFARADWVIDLLPYETRGLYGYDQGNAREEHFAAATWVQRDFCDRDPWPFADDQFDFVICSHTLEDVRDPVLVCRELSRVARSGYVEVPHVAEELTWGVHGPWVGWSHHRWLVEREGEGLVFTHKPHLLAAEGRHLPAGSGPFEALGLWWKGALPAREQVHVAAETFDPWLEGLLAAHRPPAPQPPPRGRRRRWTR